MSQLYRIQAASNSFGFTNRNWVTAQPIIIVNTVANADLSSPDTLLMTGSVNIADGDGTIITFMTL